MFKNNFHCWFLNSFYEIKRKSSLKKAYSTNMLKYNVLAHSAVAASGNLIRAGSSRSPEPDIMQNPSDKLQLYLKDAVRPSTQKTYSSYWRRYIEFCESNGVVVQDEFLCLWFFITLFNLNRFSNLKRLIILVIKIAIIKKISNIFYLL